jgi:hypothetical protein
MSLPPISRFLPVFCLLLPGVVSAKINFEKEIWPILDRSCVDCHRAAYEENGKVKKPKAGLRLDAASAILEGGENGKVLTPGDPAKSDLVGRTLLPEDDDDFMPPKGTKLSAAEKELLSKWIAEGADFGGWEGKKDGKPVVKAPVVATVSWTQMHYEKLAAGLSPAPEASLAKVTASGGRVAPLAVSNPLLAVDYLVARDQATDDKVAAVSAIKDQLAHLDLSRTSVTDSGLAVIKGLPRLTKLDLHSTKITDAALKNLAGLSNLTYLNLYDTAVTDAGLPEIAKLKGLRSVYLWKSQVTEKGAQDLQKQLPDAEVVWK